MMTKIGKAFDYVIDYMAYLAAALIAITLLVVTTQVIARYVFNYAILWAFDTTEYLLGFFAYLAVAWVLKREGHVSLDAAINFLNPRKRALVMAVTSIIAAVITLIIAWYGAAAMLDHLKRGTVMGGMSLKLPKGQVLSVMPIGFSLFAIQFLRRSYGYFKLRRKLPKEGPADVIPTHIERL